MMLNDDIQLYLSEALDQEACKKTLTGALQSRVIALQQAQVSNKRIIDCLDNLSVEDYQLNGDVILDVIEWILISAMYNQTRH